MFIVLPCSVQFHSMPADCSPYAYPTLFAGFLPIKSALVTPLFVTPTNRPQMYHSIDFIVKISPLLSHIYTCPTVKPFALIHLQNTPRVGYPRIKEKSSVLFPGARGVSLTFDCHPLLSVTVKCTPRLRRLARKNLTL